MKQYLIADSGGSKTDWCFIDSDENEEFFTTESYHPFNWNVSFFDRNRSFWEKMDQKEKIHLYFFGAGCYFAKNCVELKHFFKSLGFFKVIISSDLHSAAISSWGQINGSVAILGTGSVLFDWQGKEIVNRVGGKGHEFGDEGSGYYFGKLIFEAYKKNNLSKLQKEKLEMINISSYNLMVKYKMAQFSFLLKNEKELFDSFHIENVRMFIETHFRETNIKKICIIGSYGFYHQEIIRKEFNRINIEINQFIEKPIKFLVEQKRVFIE